MKKIFFLFLIIIPIFISCYIAPETEQEESSILLRLPTGSIPQREIGYDEGGFIAIITNIDLLNEEIDPGDPSFYNNPENALYVKEVAIDSSAETAIMEYLPIEIRLDKVPEGDKMYIYLMYIGSLAYDNPFGFFYSETPFSVKKGETTYIELTGFIGS